MENIKGLMKKVKIPNAITGVIGNSSDKPQSLKIVEKQLEEKMEEKQKVFGFIGMEAYDLFKAGKIAIPQLNNYFDKMDALNQEIQDLERQKEEEERKAGGKSVCPCGYPLKPNDKFCPNCGKVAAKDSLTCVCGAKLNENSKFCPNCGRGVGQAEQSAAGVFVPQAAMKECICGAKVPEGQGICFECGRKMN